MNTMHDGIYFQVSDCGLNTTLSDAAFVSRSRSCGSGLDVIPCDVAAD